MITNLWLGTSNVPASDGATFPVYDPATEEHLVDVADASSADWSKALDLASAAQSEWAQWSPQSRSDILREIYDEVMARKDEFAELMTREMGKPFAQAQGEVDYGAGYLRWFAEEAVRLPGRFAQSPAGNGTMTIQPEPVGPVLAITPWNFPLAMATRKIAPALAAGCTVIVKPAELTPLTMLLLGEVISGVLTRHGAPDGVVSIVTTTKAKDLSKELQADKRLRKVTFTGSTRTGKILVEQSAQHLQRTSMELGGNAPFIVCEDADMDLAIEGAIAAKMRNNGEVCVAANRFLVHSSRAQEFTDRLTQRFQGYVTGHGMEATTTLGPLVSAQQRDKVAQLVDAALAHGATAAIGGIRPEGRGYFYPATVITGVGSDEDILHEEIFGPVAVITTFEDLDEAIAKANDTDFGLAAYAFTENVHTAQRLANELEAGMVGINRGALSDVAAPFGGVKQSGFGREGGTEGIEEYVNLKYVARP